MSGSERKEQQMAIDAVGSLKRALGISHHSMRRDEFRQDELLNPICHIYTPDRESAELIGELFYRIAVIPKGAAYYDSIRPRSSQRDTINIAALDDGGYVASMRVLDAESFSLTVKKALERHLRPDKPGGRRR